MARRPTLQLGVLVSGGGRTAINLHEVIQRGELDAAIAIVISSRTDAAAVARCSSLGLRVEIADPRELAEDFHEHVAHLLRDAGVELVCLAGFLHLWHIPEDYTGRVINIHPALLPQFGGKGYYGDRVHRAVIESGATQSGCTVHFADEHYDHGPIILQRTVPVMPGDTVETLGHRVFEQELIAYPEAIRTIIRGDVPMPHPACRAHDR